MPEQETRLRVAITDSLMIDGISIGIGYRVDHDMVRVLHFDEHGHNQWELVQGIQEVDPTINLSNDVARALLDALLRHYQGASDMHTLRSDYLHERGRVDRLIDGLSGNFSNFINKIP